MSYRYVNNYATVLTTNVSDSATVITVLDTSRLPDASPREPLLLTIYHYGQDGREADWEIVEVTGINRSMHGLTVRRGMDATTPRAWVAGSHVELRITAKGMDDKASADGMKKLKMQVMLGLI